MSQELNTIYLLCSEIKNTIGLGARLHQGLPTHMCLWYHVLVESDESVDGPLPDLQRGEVGQEVIANKETHEHPVIDSSLGGGGGGQQSNNTVTVYIDFLY